MHYLLNEILAEDHSFYVYDVVNMKTIIVEEKNLKIHEDVKKIIGSEVNSSQMDIMVYQLRYFEFLFLMIMMML